MIVLNLGTRWRVSSGKGGGGQLMESVVCVECVAQWAPEPVWTYCIKGRLNSFYSGSLVFLLHIYKHLKHKIC